MADFKSLSEDTGFSTDRVSYALPFILMAMSLFGSSVFKFTLQSGQASPTGDGFGAQVSIFMVGAPLVVTIIIVGLLWWFTKRSEVKSPAPNRVATWTRIAISTLPMTLVLFLLQLIFAARFSMFEEQGSIAFSFSAITARSFFLPLLVILVTSIAGRVAGHFKGTEAIGAPFLRGAVPPLLVTWIHLIVNVGVFSIVALLVLPLSLDVPGHAVPLAFVNMGLILTSLVHLGGISATAQGDLGFDSGSFSENLTIFSRDAPGQLWLGLLVVVLALLIATCVATVTRRPAWTVLEQDKQQWASAWKLPLAFCAVWGLLSLLAMPANMSMHGSAEAAMYFGGSGAARMGVGPLAWTFLIFAVWGGLVEVLSRTLGPRLVLTFPAAARLFAGRAVHPHWGPHLGMSEPRFAFIHPDIAAAAAQPAPPAAPSPGVTGTGGIGGQAGAYGAEGPARADGAVGPIGAGQAFGPASGPAAGHVPSQDPNQGSRGGSAPSAGSAQPYSGQPSQPVGSPIYNHQAYVSPTWPQAHGSSAGPQAHGSSAGPQEYGPSTGPQNFSSPGGPQPYGTPAKPFNKKKATLVTVISGSAVILLVAALIVVTQVNGHMFGPEATVEKYFSELSDGDAEGALKVADVDVPQESRTLLSNDILGASKALPKNVTVDDAKVSGDTARVSVTYDVGGSKSTSELTLNKAGKKALFFDDWALQAPELFTLNVDAPGLSQVNVNGVDVDTADSSLSLPAFPGLYTIGLAQKSELITADPIETRAFLADDVDIENEDPQYLAATPSDGFRTEVNNQVKNLIDSCAKKTTAEPDGCPFGSSLADSYDAKGLKWSISSYPTVTVGDESIGSDDPYGEAQSSTGPNGGPAWPISSDSTGEAFVTGSYEGYDDDEPFDDTVSFSINGVAEVIDDKVVISVSDDPWDW